MKHRLLRVCAVFVIVSATLSAAQVTGGDARPATFRDFRRDFLKQELEIWKSPFQIRGNDAQWIAPLGLLTGVLIASDKYSNRQLRSSVQTQSRYNTLSNAGTVAIGGIAIASYLGGYVRKDDRLRTTGFQAATAIAHATIVTEALKGVTRRERPLEGRLDGKFGVGGSSFPSQHSAIAWGAATVFAQRYPGPLTKTLFYGGAAAVSVSRVIAERHFPSDVFVGALTGYLIGRKIAGTGGDEDKRYGNFIRDNEPVPITVASDYVALDSWIYGAFDRLAALGYAPTAFVAQRPWTRLECKRILDEIDEEQEELPAQARSLVAALHKEFASADRGSEGAVDNIYWRTTQISGRPITEGYYYASTIVNDYGRPFQSGFNALTGISAHAHSGPVSAAIRMEYQHAPAAPALPFTAREAMTVTYLFNAPLPPPTAQAQVNRLRFLDAYVSIAYSTWQFTFGQQSLWWGPGDSGALLASNNTEPVLMARVDRTSPLKLPGVLELLGPMRTQFFIGRLSGHHFVRSSDGVFHGSFDRSLSNQPFIHGQKISFKPTPNLEFGVSLTGVFGGPNFPVTAGRLRRVLFSFGNNNSDRTDPGDRRAGFDFSYRLPGLRNWLVLYNDAMSEDEMSPIGYPRRSAMNPGLYMPQVPGLRKLDFRLEAAYTDLPGLRQNGFYYFNLRYLDGYTNGGDLIGHWVGRQGKALQVGSTYWIAPRRTVSVGLRTLDASPSSGRGGTQRNAWVRSQWSLNPSWVLDASLGGERWNFPAFGSGPKSNVAFTFQVSYAPSWLRK